MQHPLPMRSDELRAYAAREAASPELGDFEGGAPPNAVWIGVGVLCLLVIVIYTLFLEPGRVKPGT
jgi:hypothetical protein